MNVKIPSNIKGKDLHVEMKGKTCKVGIKQQGGVDAIIEGEWGGEILKDDSLWTIDTSKGKRVLQLSLTKKNQMGWWDCIIKGESKIDTGKVEPENS